VNRPEFDILKLMEKRENTDEIRQNAVLEYWFGDLKEGEAPPDDVVARWWGKDQKTDDYIRENFGRDLEEAAKGGLAGWEETPRGTLALIIVLDQFSRNVYRDDPRAFAEDGRALEAALTGIAKGFDRRLHPVMRVFFYMPFMHSEDLSMQERSLELFRGLENEFSSVPDVSEMLSGNRDYAERHYEIVKRFGRYPHRNRILGRVSTPDEIEFLKQPGSSF